MLPVQSVIGIAFEPDPATRIIPVSEKSCVLRTPPVPLHWWNQIIGFFAWSYEEFTGEAQITGWLNSNKEWHWEPLPQISKGMTVDETEGDEREAIIHQIMERGFGPDVASTGHHHCTTGAFASSTDEKDEFNNKPQGVHFTLGNLNNEKWSFHGRMKISVLGTFDERGNELTPGRSVTTAEFAPHQYIEVPDLSKFAGRDLSKELVDKFVEEMVLTPGSYKEVIKDERFKFPDEWKSRVEKHVWRGGANGVYQGAGYGHYHQQQLNYGQQSQQNSKTKNQLKDEDDTMGSFEDALSSPVGEAIPNLVAVCWMMFDSHHGNQLRAYVRRLHNFVLAQHSLANISVGGLTFSDPEEAEAVADMLSVFCDLKAGIASRSSTDQRVLHELSTDLYHVVDALLDERYDGESSSYIYKVEDWFKLWTRVVAAVTGGVPALCRNAQLQGMIRSVLLENLLNRQITSIFPKEHLNPCLRMIYDLPEVWEEDALDPADEWDWDEKTNAPSGRGDVETVAESIDEDAAKKKQVIDAEVEVTVSKK